MLGVTDAQIAFEAKGAERRRVSSIARGVRSMPDSSAPACANAWWSAPSPAPISSTRLPRASSKRANSWMNGSRSHASAPVAETPRR